MGIFEGAGTGGTAGQCVVTIATRAWPILDSDAHSPPYKHALYELCSEVNNWMEIICSESRLFVLVESSPLEVVNPTAFIKTDLTDFA